MFYSKTELPMASIKSPRRNTKFIELESISSGSQFSQSVEFLHRKFSLMDGDYGNSCTNLVSAVQQKPNDYLHPKYSLPPMKMDVTQHLYEFEKLLRTPAQIKIHLKPKSSSVSSTGSTISHQPGDPFIV